MSVRRIFAFVVLVLLVAFGAHAAGHSVTISDRLDALRLGDGMPRAVGSAAVREFEPSRFEQPFHLESGAVSVTLRPVGARHSSARAEHAGTAYYGAFRGADVLRGGNFEAVVARNRAGLESIAYEIADMRGVLAAVPSAGGIRFVTGTPSKDVLISAPLAIDAAGRPSTRVRWALTAGATTHGTIHLVTDDASLRYPVTIAYRPGSAQRPSVQAMRPSDPVTNQTGSIQGNVTDAVSGAPLAFEFVYIYDSTGNFVTYGETDTAGHYFSTDGLSTGVYYAFSWPGNYLPELYNNIPCNGCDVTTGTPINVTDDIVTSNINFAVTPYYGRITGTITNGTAPLSDVVVLFYDGAGDALGSASSDAGGFYEAFVPAANSPFKARTFNATYPGLIDVLYDGFACIACNVSTGTPISVSPGGTTSGINFNLQAGGSIAGSVTDASGPVYQASLEVFNSSGTLVANTQTDFDGNYSLITGLVAGTYYVRASAFAHAPELYNNIPCTSCNVTTGTPVTVTAGQTTSNISFVLTPTTTTISGRVFDASTNAGIEGVLVLLYNSTGLQVTFGITDTNGDYSAPVDAGTYYARTDNGANSGYLEQLYNNIDCTGCNVLSGTPIVAVGGTPSTGINFGLHTSGGTISGRVTSAETGDPIAFASIAIYSSTGLFVSYSTADSNGDYTSADELTAGTYYATSWASGFATQLYSGISCASGCNVTTGTGITVNAGQATTGINFALALPIARITGHVADASNSAPISGAAVMIFDGNGSVVANATTNSAGNYTASLSADGVYYAIAAAAGYADQLYNGHACNGCDPTTGNPITATIGSITPNISFLLQVTACAGMTLEPSSLPNGQVGSPYSAQLSTTGAVAPVTYAVTAGDLPDGVTLNGSTGAISGTASGAGTFIFVITATGANGCSAARNYTVEIASTDTPTVTVLEVDPNPATYGDSVTLTATVTPTGATGTVTFKNGATVLGTGTLDANDQATLVVMNLDPGTYPLTATYGGAPTFAPSTSSTVNLVVDKFAPNINWSNPQNIVYGTALSSTQLNATASGVNGAAITGSFSYNPPAGTVLNAGTHITLAALFVPDDQVHYSNATSTVELNVLKADPVITWTPGDYTFGTPLGAAQLNATANVPGTFVYDPPAGTILPAGQQTLSAHFTPTDTANYNEADVTASLNGAKADPVFTNLSAPSIIIGTASTTISGKIAAGSVYPSGSVLITINGVTQSAAIQAADGTFSSAFATASLVPPGYTISFIYAGDANFNPASDTSTLTVHYGTTGTKVSNGNGGGTVPFRVSVFDANNVNLGSSSLQVTAYGVRLVTSSTWLPAPSNGNQGPLFQLQSNGTYMFTLKTTGLAAGNYVFGYTIGADTTIYTISFTVK